jgi:hypothetical protein
MMMFVDATLLLLVVLLINNTPTNAQDTDGCVNEINICNVPGKEYRALPPSCKKYVQCEYQSTDSSYFGQILNTTDCIEDFMFDNGNQICNYKTLVNCDVRSCAPTSIPSTMPSGTLSMIPSMYPTMTQFPSTYPSYSPSSSPSIVPSVLFDSFRDLETEQMKVNIENTILQSYNPSTGIASPSTKYSYDGLIAALREMSLEGITSDGRSFIFYMGESYDTLDYGRTNLAAFLANAMTESIVHDVCDEFSIDGQEDGIYAISNSCGQNFRNYQDEVCVRSNQVVMSCNVDTSMEIVSSESSSSVMVGRAPPPFSCRPKTDPFDYAGYWDVQTGLATSTAYSNSIGRTDLEGCCWWGRGVLLTRGVCNIGKLNYYLGKRANDTRGEGRFPEIDFCRNPEATCTDDEGVRWITGLFEWIERIQSYTGLDSSISDWDYMSNLMQFVDGGMIDDSFIDTVSSIFVTGCHSDCSSIDVTMSEERKENFKTVLRLFGLPRMTQFPTFPPTDEIPETPMPITPSPVFITDVALPPAQSLMGPTPPPTQLPSSRPLIPIESGSYCISLSWITILTMMIGIYNSFL